jgi:hypothetical protein
MRGVFGIQIRYGVLLSALLFVERGFASDSGSIAVQEIPVVRMTPLTIPTLFSWGLRELPKEEEESSIVTDRPHFSEASSLVGLGRWQIETGYTYFGDSENGARESTSSLPEALLRMGVLAEWFELRIGANFITNRSQLAGASDSNGGFDDLYLGAKLALFEQKGWLPEVALFPQTRIPVGQSEISDHAWLPGFNLAYSWVLNDWLELECNTQLNRRRDDTDNFYAEFIQTANVEYQLNEKLGAFTEWFGLMPNGASSPSAGPEHYFHSGFVYLITPNLQYDVHAAVGLNEHADDFFAGSGLSARF